MSIHKGLDKYFDRHEVAAPQVSQWRFRYPNTADFNFNYWTLLNNASQGAIAENTNPGFRVAIVGAGVAGLAAARELFRSGYTNLDIYEASDRLGGRNWSIVSPDGWTTYEMGAMRMPFFWPDDPKKPPSFGPASRNAVLDYYCTLFGITTQDFPDPGAGSAPVTTGIYISDGFGPDPQHPYPQPTMLLWAPNTPPPDPSGVLAGILAKWTHFAKMITDQCRGVYGTDQWEPFWRQLASNYWTVNFRELVYLPAIPSYDPSRPGYFGGLGMSDLEAWNFYVIGAGDGGWGAFYDISALYPIRTLLFGFANHHQLIQGTFNPDGVFRGGPQRGETVMDSLGQTFASPHYLGLQSVADSFFFAPVTSPFVPPISLYDATKDPQLGVHLYTQSPVTGIQRLDGGKLEVVSANHRSMYDAVIMTPTTWALELSGVFETIDPGLLPPEVTLSVKESHYITSSKVFYPLKQRFWEDKSVPQPIPQVISTDSFIQDVYGIALTVGSQEHPGVLLASYTWEDDAVRLLAEDDQKLAQMCLEELDRVLIRTNFKKTMSEYINTDAPPVVIHWEDQPSYRGCAKLYRERSWELDRALLTYNQQSSAQSGIYFAGEAYSVEGGWTEPALRLGLDAVLHVIKNSGGTFLNGFDFHGDYPVYDMGWHPTELPPGVRLTYVASPTQ